ncbi:tetratricopeptide repeat protein [Rhodococcus sp. 1168]|uniref:tetratricopeptide repeat protein n=1 Tax=Rhodococcus sp. 1168 TaxID=2018041 RepID=UPI000A0D8747|nr:tetratricopeptide repeat protein [Rhodococcus sp. 1168]ORI21169.1 hypothetical protein BJI47_17155 [Rhodococcus sp. 1168]
MTEDAWPSSVFLTGLDLLDQGRTIEALGVMCAVLADCESAGHAHRIAHCLRWIGALQLELGELDSAVDSLRYALRLLVDVDVDVDDVELTGDCMGILGMALSDLGEAQEAAKLLEATCAVCADWGDIESEGLYSNALGEVYEKLETFGPARRAYARAAECFRLAEHWAEAADSSESAGTCSIEIDDSVGARNAFRTARDLYEHDGDEVDAARCRFLFGLCSGLNNIDEAEIELLSAIDYFGSTSHPDMEGDCWEQLGELYLDAERVDDAFTAFGNALDRHQETTGGTRSAHCHRQLARLHAHRRSVEPTIASLTAARDIYADVEPAEAVDIDISLGGILEDLGRMDESLVVYSRARNVSVVLDDSVAVALCDMHIGTVHMHMGDHTAADSYLLRASEVFAASGERFNHARSLRYRAAVRSALAELPAAEVLLFEALRVVHGLEESAGLVNDCRQDLALLLYLSSDYQGAIDRLEEVRAEYLRQGKREQADLCLQNIGAAYSSLGRYSDAERALVESRNALEKSGISSAAASSDAHLSQLYLETGRLEESAQAFERARRAFESMGATDRVAMLDQNLAGLYISRGELDAAEEGFLRATALFTRLGQRQKSALCRCNLGAVAILKSQFARAAHLIGEALKELRQDPAHRRTVAWAERNCACAELLLGNKDRGLVHLGAARTAALELGTMLDAAKCDYIAALWDVSDTGDDRLREAVDLALPALQYLDAQRFQFNSAATREAWAKTVALWTSNLFDWAYRLGDEALMAELIESAINSGTHVSDTSTDFKAISMNLASFGHEIDGGVNVPALDIGTRAGSLIAGAILPMQPPPMLVMPDGRIALDPYFRAVDSRYGKQTRPSAVSVV